MRASEHLPERWNAAEWFIGRHVAEGRGDRTAIVSDEGQLGYAQLDLQVRRFAGALRAAGVRPGMRVALVLRDGPAFSIAFWGTIAAGAVAVPLSTFADPAAPLADCDPELVVCDEARPAGELPAWTVPEMRRRLADAAPAPYAATHRDGFAFILYTSGTTGEPKGAVHLMHDMWVCAHGFGEHILAIRPEDRTFSASKLFFAFGLGNAQYYPFAAGASAVLWPGRSTPEALLDQIRRHRPTLFFAVPAVYAQLLAAIEAGAPAELGGLRLCVSAGETLPAALFERWRARTGLEILDGLGSTEACQTFVSNRPGACRPGSSGLPVPGYDIRVVDGGGQEAAPGEIGDLLVRGDSIMALYWQRDDATRHVLSGDWLRTGDKYHLDEDGYLWHDGRADDLFKVSAQWVAPVEVERVLSGHAAVLECAVIAARGADGMARPHAVVVLRPGATASAGELMAFAGARLAHHKVPRSVSFADGLPRTATGKLRRFLLAPPAQ